MVRKKSTVLRALRHEVDPFILSGILPSVNPRLLAEDEEAMEEDNIPLSDIVTQTTTIADRKRSAKTSNANEKADSSSSRANRRDRGSDDSEYGYSEKIIAPSMSERDANDGKPIYHPMLPGVDLIRDEHNLTQLQVLITKAFLVFGEPICFQELLEFVGPIWPTLRKRDGSTYNSDCKKALQANLRFKNPMFALFRPDPHRGNSWYLNHPGDVASIAVQSSETKTSGRSNPHSSRGTGSGESSDTPEPRQRSRRTISSRSSPDPEVRQPSKRVRRNSEREEEEEEDAKTEVKEEEKEEEGEEAEEGREEDSQKENEDEKTKYAVEAENGEGEMSTKIEEALVEEVNSGLSNIEFAFPEERRKSSRSKSRH